MTLHSRPVLTHQLRYCNGDIYYYNIIPVLNVAVQWLARVKVHNIPEERFWQ